MMRDARKAGEGGAKSRGRVASRRDLFKAGAAVAAAGATPVFADAAAAQTKSKLGEDRAAIERLLLHSDEADHKILFRGATIITMDPKLGDFARGDLLVQGSKIVAVAPKLEVNAQSIDASDAILIPGFVDCHRHSWEGQLRRINPNAATLAAYTAATHRSFALHYRPRDLYVGNMITALGCIDAGITCVIDNSHNSRSAAHSDEAIHALFDSGIRAVHASGAPQAGDWDHQWPQDLARLKQRWFASEDQLVTLRMFSGPERANWALARQLGLRITTEFQGAAMAEIMEAFWNEKLMGPDNTFNHCGALPDSTWQHIKKPASRSMSARAPIRNMGSARAYRRCKRRSITASRRASASTTRPPTAPTCSPRCASPSTSSVRSPPTGASMATPTRRRRSRCATSSPARR